MPEQKAFHGEDIRISALVGVDGHLKDYVFKDCKIMGPAIFP
jgi:hypothetical protein